MSGVNNFFDLALAIIFPEVAALKKIILAKKTITAVQMSKELANLRNIKSSLPTFKGSTKAIETAKRELAKTLKVPINEAYIKLLSDPAGFSKKLGELSKTERKHLGESITEAAGDKEAAPLSSSWLTYGVFEPTTPGVGALTLTTKQGHSYTYYGVSVGTWERMKAATGSGGSGAGSVFWVEYLWGYKGAAATKQLALAFRLSK